MRISGSLALGEIYTILRLLGRTGSSGLLRVHTDNLEATIAVHGGCVLRASIGTGPALGEALVSRGAIEPDAIAEALALQRILTPRKPVGSILVGLGVIGKARVGEALVEGVRNVIAQVATWSVGSYEFDPCAALERDTTFAGVAIDSLIPGSRVMRFAVRGR